MKAILKMPLNVFHKCERIFINRTREHTSLSLSMTGTLGSAGRMGPQRPVPPARLDHLRYRCPGCPRGAQGGGTQTHGKDSYPELTDPKALILSYHSPRAISWAKATGVSNLQLWRAIQQLFSSPSHLSRKPFIRLTTHLLPQQRAES